MSCSSKSSLYVDKELLAPSQFANNFVGSRQIHQQHKLPNSRYIVHYNLGYLPNAKLQFLVVTKDLKEHLFQRSISTRKGYVCFEFSSKELDILTYKAQIVNCNGLVINEHRHALWVSVIEFDTVYK